MGSVGATTRCLGRVGRGWSTTNGGALGGLRLSVRRRPASMAAAGPVRFRSVALRRAMTLCPIQTSLSRLPSRAGGASRGTVSFSPAYAPSHPTVNGRACEGTRRPSPLTAPNHRAPGGGVVVARTTTRRVFSCQVTRVCAAALGCYFCAPGPATFYGLAMTCPERGSVGVGPVFSLSSQTQG